jgi:hypothetical protein
MADDQTIHLGARLDAATLDLIADVICGDDREKQPVYRSSQYLTKFFQDAGINAVHDGSTRKRWVVSILEQLNPADLEKVILRLGDLREYKADVDLLKMAMMQLNKGLILDGFKVGYTNNKPVIRFSDPVKVDDEILSSPPAKSETEFLSKNFGDDLRISDLKIDAVLTEYLQDRIDEANNCEQGKVTLGTIFLLGSTLEGILLAIAIKDQAKFMSAKAAPKDRKSGKTKKVHDWNLNQLIDVSHELNILSQDVKNFSHTLRDFRNYIHPYQQMSQNFKPDRHTENICWQVFKAAFAQLKAGTI